MNRGIKGDRDLTNVKEDLITLKATEEGYLYTREAGAPAVWTGVSAVKRAVINKADATSSAIVAAVPNKRIIVLDYTLIAGGTVNVTWQTKPVGAAVALSGAMPMVANAGIATTNEHGLIETAVGDALHMLLSAAVQVSGHLSYVEAD